MDVDVGNRLQLGDFAEVVVVGNQFGPQRARQADQLRIHFRLFTKIRFVDFDFFAGASLDAAEHFQTTPAASTTDRVGGIRDKLKLFQHEARHHYGPFQEVSLDQLGDASVNDGAGVEHEEIFGLALRREPNEGDDQVKVLFVAAHGQDHADVTKSQKQTEANQPANRLVLHVNEQAGVVNQQSDHCSQQQAERGRGKGAKRKALDHLVDGDEQAAKTKTDQHAPKAIVDQLRPHLADREAAQRGQAEKQNAQNPDGHKSNATGRGRDKAATAAAVQFS